jgi:molybdenum cofactor synthesis domain-containing protein
MKKNVTAGFLIIGDEILSGRTSDANLNFLAKNLTELGINLKEVRVVPDIEEKIIEAVNALKTQYDYLFTSGGIGPTHDDITSLSIAKATNDNYTKNEQAAQILIDYYGKENVNEARMKMAFMPSKAKLLDNPISSAPGFFIENIFVMAGVPKIFQAMFEAVKKQLITGNKILAKEIKVDLTESLIAKDLERLQKKYPQITMGSYPGNMQTSLVFRSTEMNLIESATKEMIELLERIKSGSIIEIK